MKFSFWEGPRGTNVFDDSPFWECPDDFDQDGYFVANGKAPSVVGDEDTKPVEDEEQV